MKRRKEMIPEVFEREVIEPLLNRYRKIMPDEEIREIREDMSNLLEEGYAAGPLNAGVAQILVQTTLELGLSMIRSAEIFGKLVLNNRGDDGDTEANPS
jgi:hypothetical protein